MRVINYFYIGVYILWLIERCMSDICNTCLCSDKDGYPTINCQEKQLRSNDMLNFDLLMLDEHQMLHELILSKNDISELPSHIFKKLKRLKRLNLSQNLITEIHVESLRDLSSLQDLNLSMNQFKTFDDSLLQSLPTLFSLNLSHNDITAVGPTTSINGRKLNILDLSYNNISEINQQSFGSFPNLEKLDLSFNIIQTIPEDTFLNLQLLKALYIQNNLLNSLDLKIFPKSLLDMNCGYNMIENVEYTASDIQKLSIENNNISTIPRDLEKLTQLQYLNLSGNNISSFPRMILENLESLDISCNKLTDISDAFSTTNFPKLNNFSVSGNPMKKLRFSERIKLTSFSANNMDYLEAIEQDAFENLLQPSDGCINLAISNNNKLTVIHEKSLIHLQLCSLDLSNNQITTISQKLLPLSKDSKMYYIDLQGNPFTCNCSLQWMLTDLVPKLYKYQNKLLDNLRCNLPSPISNMRMVHWYGWKEEIFCIDPSHFKANLVINPIGETSNADSITFGYSTGLLAVMGTVIGILTILIIIGLLLTHKIARRRRRFNRRF